MRTFRTVFYRPDDRQFLDVRVYTNGPPRERVDDRLPLGVCYCGKARRGYSGCETCGWKPRQSVRKHSRPSEDERLDRVLDASLLELDKRSQSSLVSALFPTKA